MMRPQPRAATSARLTLGFALGLALIAALPVRSQDQAVSGTKKAPSAEQDLKVLQGRWERTLAGDDDAHGAAKAAKEIAGNVETVTYVNDAGEAVYATTADFKVETAGRVKLYTYSNLKVTKGKDEGGDDASKRAVSYIYRVEGDLYHEAHGLLVDSPAGSKPAVVTWKRVK